MKTFLHKPALIYYGFFIHPQTTSNDKTSNPMKTKLLLTLFPFYFILFTFYFLIFNSSSTTFAEIRYVSKTGTATPPYTTWATASDSIQKCINYSIAGDTIYVANGVYKEKIIVNKSLTVVGSSIDSCIIDTRELVTPTDFQSVYIGGGDIFFKNFYIITSDNHTGTGIYNSYTGLGTLIIQNKVQGAMNGIMIVNSHANIRSNILIDVQTGVHLEAFNENYFPVISNNIITTNFKFGRGIRGFFGTSPTILNNYVFCENGGTGFLTIMNNKETKNNIVVNTTIDSEYGYMFSLGRGKIENNFLIGKGYDNINFSIYRGSNSVVNNNIVKGINAGYKVELVDTVKFKFNNAWETKNPFIGFTPDSTNKTVDPMFVNEDSLDFHLQMFSPLIDAGDPTIIDPDGSRSDIGVYGGPLGESYKYKDLPPKAPRGIEAFSDSNLITIKWRKNTEADFGYYKLFRDTTADFTVDTTTLVGIFADTLYIQFIPSGVEKLFFKLTAVDNQGNESAVSEEIGLILVSVNDKWQVVDDYRLYPNFPNPFNPSTTIPFRLSQRAYVKLAVYDIKGELIEYLINEEMEKGYYETNFTTRGLPSGVYLYKIDIISSETRIPLFSEMRKMVLIK